MHVCQEKGCYCPSQLEEWLQRLPWFLHTTENTGRASQCTQGPAHTDFRWGCASFASYAFMAFLELISHSARGYWLVMGWEKLRFKKKNRFLVTKKHILF